MFQTMKERTGMAQDTVSPSIGAGPAENKYRHNADGTEADGTHHCSGVTCEPMFTEFPTHQQRQHQ